MINIKPVGAIPCGCPWDANIFLNGDDVGCQKDIFDVLEGVNVSEGVDVSEGTHEGHPYGAHHV